MYLIMTFACTHDAMKAEHLLHKGKVPVTVIPIPRYISADCGIALRFVDEDRARVEDLLQDCVAYQGIHAEQ